MDYVWYYFLEDWLSHDVTAAFRDHGYLTPEEFFSIVIWKANRAKALIKRRLLRRGSQLATVIKTLTRAIHEAATDEERLRVLLKDWNFSLPMASAILSVLYPTRFTVYDIRVREELGIMDFAGRKDEIERYFKEFVPRVAAVTEAKELRDKDRYLWGKSSYESLQKFLREP